MAARKKKPIEGRALTFSLGESVGLVGGKTYSGVTVNESTALGISALWCGIRTISQDVGSLSPELYQQDADGTRQEVESHPVATLLDDPNPELTRPVVFETLMAHALLWGNAFAEIQRDGAGKPVALWPIHPRNVQVMRDDNGGLVYRVTIDVSNLAPEQQVGTQTYLQPADVFHVPGLSLSGCGVGERLLSIARETLGFGIATQRYGASFFGNACRPGGFLTSPNQMSEQGVENLRRSFQMLHGGTENAGKTVLLEEGVTFQPYATTNEQSQYRDVLSWYVTEVARLLVIPPSKLMDLQRATWGNLTELNRDYLTTTLRPWLTKFEAEANRKLLSYGERKTLYVEFDTSTLLRADQSTRYAAYQVGITAGFLSVDEVRRWENLPPMPTPTPTPTEVNATGNDQGGTQQDPQPVTEDNAA